MRSQTGPWATTTCRPTIAYVSSQPPVIPMAVELENVRRRELPARTRSHVSYDAEAGFVVTRARLYEDGELASEALTARPTGA